jgi:molecular chaperone DnaK
MADDELNPVVGIDLGTTYSAISRWAGDRPVAYNLVGGQTLPSIVYIQEGGAPLVGKYARQKLIIDPPNSVQRAKRYMDDDNKVFHLRGKDYTPVDVSAMILARLREEVESKYPSAAGFEFAGAIVTHPHYFKYPQIARTKEAAEEAGLPIIRLLSEPVAAALCYGFEQYKSLDEERSEKLLIFDLGGGTFDVTVLEVINELNKLTFRVLSVGGDDMLGGTNFDEEFMKWALEEAKIDLGSADETTRDRSMAKLLEAAIEAKEQLSHIEDVYLAVPSILPGQHLDMEVTRDQFNELIEPFCSRIRKIVKNTVDAAGLREGELDRSIMVGGSSRIPIMREIVKEETDADPWANADPDLAVCLGAAFLAAIYDERVEGVTPKEIVVEEATSHALGVEASGGLFSVVIPANRQAPIEAMRIYTIRQPELVIQPAQGKAARGAKVTDEGIRLLEPIPVSGVQLGDNGEADVKITFKVNDQQILFIKIEAPGVYEERQMEF